MTIAIYDDYLEICTHYLKDELIQDIEQTLKDFEMEYIKNDRYLTVNNPKYKFLVRLAENNDILLL